MATPPPKKSRSSRRRENTKKHHPERFEARRKRHALLRLWQQTESAEERGKQAEALLKAMDEEAS